MMGIDVKNRLPVHDGGWFYLWILGTTAQLSLQVQRLYTSILFLERL